METYKIIPKNWTAYCHKYEIGKTYKVTGELKPRENGFNSCKELIDCYNFYNNLYGTSHVCIAKVPDNPEDFIEKQLVNKRIISREITILKELSQEEIESILIKEINSKDDIKLQCLILETLVSQQKLSVSFLKQFKNKLDFKKVIVYQLLSEDFIEEIIEDLKNKDEDLEDYLIDICRCQDLSEDFIRKFSIKKFSDRWFWYYISMHQKLSEDFIREFKDKVYWQGICMNQKLSESFIREFKNELGLEYISTYQELSESFIREFKDEWNWSYISKFQKLSEDFIEEFKDRVDWHNIYVFQILSPNFAQKYKNKINFSLVIEQRRQKAEITKKRKKELICTIY